MSASSTFFRMCFVVALLAKRTAIVNIILKFRIFIPVFDVVRGRCFNRQPITVKASVSPELFAQITSAI